MDKNLRAYVGELAGTFSVVFLVAAAVCAHWAAGPSDQQGLQVLGIAVVYGLAYAVALAITLPHSGGYLNPAVTLMLWVFKRFDGLKTICLIFVQLLGAALAGGLVRLVFTEIVLTQARMGTPHVNLKAFDAGSVTASVLVSGVGMELGLTLILTFVIFATIIDPRSPRWLGPWGKRLVGLWVGLVVIAITLVGFNLTGACVNPARWFGTAVWESTVPGLQATQYKDHLVYWFGPIAGALIAGVVYTMLILPVDQEEKAAPGPTVGAGKMAAGATLFRAKK